MLNDIAKYAEFLKLFIEYFEAYNECIEPIYLPRDDTKKDKNKKQRHLIIHNDSRMMRDLDTPLHCAVRQLNEDLIEWLLEKPGTEVNLRNKYKETALAILCQMYDSCKELLLKLKTRIEDIKKERKTADKKQQLRLDDETIKVSAQKEELTMNASTILKLIKRLLEKGADFNVYMNEGALPFDFLRKYDTEADVAEIINSDVKSNVAMTEKPPEQLSANAEGKTMSKKRIVKFYKKTEDRDMRVTEELLEIFICFNDLEKFKYYWKDFKVTSDNVKKVITQLLHVAVVLNYTPYVDHIIKKASKEIFKLEENKETNTQDSTLLVTPDRNNIRWCCFKCCQKRHHPDSQTQSEAIDPVVTSDSQDKYKLISERPTSTAVCQNEKNPSSSDYFAQTQDKTFKLEQNETDYSEYTCAGTSNRISMNAGGSCKKNSSATEGAELQTQSGTSKLQVTDPHTESGTSKLKGIVPQMQSETIESQDNNPDSQDNHLATTDGTLTSDEQPTRWCCLKCFQKKQNPSLPDGTNPQALRQNCKESRLTKAEENKMVHRNELKGLLKMVCLHGNFALLNMFLKMMNDRLLVNENPLLVNTLNAAYAMKQKKKSNSLLECMKILINNHRKVDMYCVDKNGNTALHLALLYRYDTIALLMLKKVHGLLGFRNRQNLTPIEYGRPQFWDDYLNNCISTNNDESKLSFDVGFLKPPAKDESGSTSKSSASKWYPRCIKRVEEMKETHNSKYHFTRTVNDMTALRLISLSKDRKEFLMHPVIIAFITMKWKRLCHWHIMNLLLTTITMGTFITYTLMPCPSGGWKYGVMACAVIGACIIFVREIMQMFLLRWSYVTIDNLVDIINVVFIGIVLGCGCDRDGWCEYVPICLSLVFVSLALQATFLLGASWNNLSIKLYMFKTVSSSFFYSFLSFSPVIVAFAFAFNRMYNDSSDISISDGTERNSSAENFNNFPSVWDATIKTLVMLTGEFEAANIAFDGGRWMLFVAFVFVAPIVILNLINGLAVSDIAAIRQESEFISICRKIKLIERYERAIVEPRFTISGCLQWLFREPLLPSPFFEKYESIIYVMLNEKNKVIIKVLRKEKSTNERGEESTPTDKNTLFDDAIKRASKGRARIASNNLQPIPVVPWLPSWFLKYYIGTRWFQWVLYMSLDQSYVDKAKIIVRNHSKNNSDRVTNELADTEQTDGPGLVNKTMHNKTLSLSGSAARLSKTNSRDAQIEKLQEQIQNITQILNDKLHQSAGKHATKAELTAGTSKISHS